MTKTITVTLVLCFATTCSADLVFDWATVGNVGNLNDTHAAGYGGVGYDYRISKHEVTNEQYAYFLGKVAVTDGFGGRDPNLFNPRMDITRSGSSGSYKYVANTGFETNPVNYVSFFDAMRFTNWLENGQGTAGTESGVYSITNGTAETRAGGATYFIPSEDEWYKAAYHDPNAPGDYWDYPTMSNTAPTAEAPAGGANSANTSKAVGDTTAVGAYHGSPSFYGTFDQAGNVFEMIDSARSSSARTIRGGAWMLAGNPVSQANNRASYIPTGEAPFVGFRVARVP